MDPATPLEKGLSARLAEARIAALTGAA